MRGESAAAVAAAAAAAAARPGKRPLRALSAAEKMEAIQRVHEGESKASVARDIGVPESTLRGWCKSEHKIRGMARNSSTPDSEAAHSPASSSGHPATSSGLGPSSTLGHNNSEDESGVSPPKRMRADEGHYGAASASDLTANGFKSASNDYLNLLNNLISNGSVSPTQGALLCQQLGLFQTASTKQQQQQLSFVENGLQYSSASASKSHKRSSTSSAIAPTSHVDSVSKSGATRKSLPAAAEAPLTSLPLSPRRGETTSVHQQQQQQQSLHHYNQLAASSSSSASGSGKRDPKIDPALLLWLDHQQQYISQKTPVSLSTVTPSTDWFWQYCKNYGGAALLAAATNLVNLNNTSVSANMNSSGSSAEQVAATTTTTTSSSSEAVAAAVASSDESAGGGGKSNKKYKHHHSMRKSPSKARAMVEDAVCINNNNECARRSLNLESMDEDVVVVQQQQQQQQPTTTTTEAKEDKEEESNISFEEALQHARIFSKWLENYRDPTVCVSQIVQFRVMLNNLEKKNNNAASASAAVVNVRRTRKKTPQSISQ